MQTMKSLYFCLLSVFSIASKSAVNAQFTCVVSCDPAVASLAVVRMAGNCCAGGAGGFVPLLPSPTTAECQSCVDFQSLQPQIQTTVTPINIDQDAQFTCSISSSDPGISVAGTIQWLGPNGTVLVESGPNVDSLDLDFEPFEVDDLGDYKCIAQVSSPNLPPGVTTTISRTISISSPPGAPVTISESQPPTAGEPYTLNCVLNQEGQTIEWIDSDGNVISSSDGVIVGITMSGGGMTTRTLSFTNLRSSDTGYYTCRNPIYDLTKQVITNFPQPSATITQPPQPPMFGEPFQPECFGSSEIPGGTFEASWVGPNGNVIATQSSMGQNVSLLLPITSLAESDGGIYECRILVSSPFLDRDVLARDILTLDITISTQQPTPDDTTQPTPGDTTQPTPDDTTQPTPGDTTQPPATTSSPVTDPVTTTTPQELVNECDMGLDNCSRRKICTYRGRAKNCIPVATCVDTEEGFECRCIEGFQLQGDRVTCADINECIEEFDNCLPDAKCINRLGSFVCRCSRGYIGDGVECCVRKKDAKNFLDAQDKEKTKRTKKTKTTRGTPKGTNNNCIESTRKTKTRKGTKCVDVAELMLDDSCRAVIDDYFGSTRSKTTRGKKSRKTKKHRRH